MRSATKLGFVLAVLWGLGPLAAKADIVTGGDGPFQAAVDKCLQMIIDAGGDGADIVKCLESSPHDVKIKPGTGFPETNYDNPGDANSPAAGGTGAGTGSTVTWDPNCTDTMLDGDGVKADPCAELLHELTHAKDADKGMRDPRTNLPGNNGIKANEVKACTVENKYRKEKGLPLRKKYGGNDLPPSAIPVASQEAGEPNEN